MKVISLSRNTEFLYDNEEERGKILSLLGDLSYKDKGSRIRIKIRLKSSMVMKMEVKLGIKEEIIEQKKEIKEPKKKIVYPVVKRITGLFLGDDLIQTFEGWR